MINKTVVLAIIYSLIGIGALLIMSHLVTSIRIGMFSKLLRTKDLSNEDILFYKRKTLTSRKYARLGGILVFAGILSFVIFSIIHSQNRL